MKFVYWLVICKVFFNPSMIIMLLCYISEQELVYFVMYSHVYTLLHFSDLGVLILVRRHRENSQFLCSSGEDSLGTHSHPQTRSWKQQFSNKSVSLISFSSMALGFWPPVIGQSVYRMKHSYVEIKRFYIWIYCLTPSVLTGAFCVFHLIKILQRERETGSGKHSKMLFPIQHPSFDSV